MKTRIDEWLGEGKSSLEISKLILSEEESKGLSAEAIAELISDGQKAFEIQKSLNDSQEKIEAKKAQDAEAKKLDDKIEAGVKSALKSLDIETVATKSSAPKNLSWFNPVSKSFVPHEERPSEAYFKMNEMLKAVAAGDTDRAKGISKEIDQDNAKIEAYQSGIKYTPTVSDVTTRGSYSIPTEVNGMIEQMLINESVMLGLVSQDNLIYNSKIYPLMYGMSVVDIADQSTALTEKNPTFTNPTVNMVRAGAFSTISNLIVQQKGSDIVNAFISAYVSEFALFLDQRLAAGNVTGQNHLVDGIIFDANTVQNTAIARSALSIDTLSAMKNALSPRANMSKTAFVGNRRVVDDIGKLNDTSGRRLFPDHLSGGKMNPWGIPVVTNPHIISTLDIGGDDYSGTDDALLLCDFSKVIAGVSKETRIEFSNDFQFANDALTVRAIKMYGQKVISGSSTAGTVAVCQELTN